LRDGTTRLQSVLQAYLKANRWNLHRERVEGMAIVATLKRQIAKDKANRTGQCLV
jgi:hypothetical protein